MSRVWLDRSEAEGGGSQAKFYGTVANVGFAPGF